MTHDWYFYTDDSNTSNIIRILLIDYKKAFDRINPNILIKKLRSFNVPPSLIKWIANFLTGRFQSVKIDSYHSDWLEIWENVPQGTLLGILLFLIMIKNLLVIMSAIHLWMIPHCMT